MLGRKRMGDDGRGSRAHEGRGRATELPGMTGLRQGRHGISRRRALQTLAGWGAGVLGFSSYAFAIEPMWRLAVTRYKVTPRRWPAPLRLSIAVIADVHAGGPAMPESRIAAIVAATNALTPDLIVLLGDFAASHRFRTSIVPPQRWSRALGRLKAPLGVHAILGNHDWWDDLKAQQAGKGPVIGRRVLEQVGIPVYENDVATLVKDGRRFWLAGLGDQWAFPRRPARRRARRSFAGVDDLEGTLGKVADDAPIILLAHEPDIFPRVPDRVALTLAGHTHGGQIRCLGYSPIVPSRFGNRYAYGHVVEDGRHLIVSGGLGCSMLPVRIGVPPEIVMVDVAA